MRLFSLCLCTVMPLLKTNLILLCAFEVLFQSAQTDYSFCPDGWVAFHGSCYLFPYKQSVSFVEAQHYCRLHESRVVRIDNSLENAFLREYLRGLRAEEHWIGINDIMIEGIWEWSDTEKQANFTDWFPGQPGSEAGQEDCAVMATQHDFQWADLPCSTHNAPLCEMSGYYDGTNEIVG